MPKVVATPCVVRTAGIAAPFVLAAFMAAAPHSNGARAQVSERSLDLGTEPAVNEDSNGGAAKALLWVTDHGNGVACE